VVFVDRNQLPVTGNATQVVDLSHCTFLEKRIVTIPAMFFDIAAQLLLGMGVKHLEIEPRSVGVIWNTGCFQDDGQPQHPDHLGDLSWVLQFKLLGHGTPS
jgi:hypothetical protein